MIDLSTLEGSQIKKGRLVARADMEELLVAMQAPLPKQHKKKIFEVSDDIINDVMTSSTIFHAASRQRET